MFPCSITRLIVDPVRSTMNRHQRNVRDILKVIDKTQWYERQQLLELQNRKLARLCLSAYRNTNYYKRLFDDVDINPVEVTRETLPYVPRLDKSLIRNHFEDLIDRSQGRSNLSMCSSGGSTGEPVRILQNSHAKAFGAAVTQRNYYWTGWYPGRVHHKLWGAVRDLPDGHEPVARRVWSYLYNRRFINAYEISDEAFEVYNKSSKIKPPYLLECYSNILYEFAKFLEASHLDPMKPSAIISSAGTLYDFQRQTIERCFGSNLYNRYGCRELGNIAHECPSHSYMHINMERYIVEVVKIDSHGVGDILVTDLENYAFPMIRYRIGDRGKLSDDICGCGRGLEMLEKVVGRSLDVIETPDGRKISGELFIRLFRAFDKVILGQAILKSKTDLEVNLKVQRPFSTDEKERFKAAVEKYTGPTVDVSLNFVSQLSVTRTGKYRPVITDYDCI